MSFHLVYGDHDLVLPLALDAEAEERLVDLMKIGESPSIEQAALARRITDAISTLVGCPAAPPPTEKQMKYCISIARELSLTIPPEVLQFRDAMTAFLGLHAPTYRQRRGWADR